MQHILFLGLKFLTLSYQ